MAASTSSTTTTPPENASSGELVRWAVGCINRGDVDVLKGGFWTAESVERFPDRTCHGPAEIAAYFEEARAGIADWNMEIVTLVESGDDVFFQWHLTGRHVGELLGIAPTGKDLAIDGIDHFVVRDGHMVSNFVVFDQMQYARQLGMMPPDGSAADKALKGAFNARTALVKRLKG